MDQDEDQGGSVVKVKVGEMEEKTREVITRRMGKEVVGCFQVVLGKNFFLFQFKEGQKGDISASSLSYLCSKEEVGQEVDETISNFPKIVQVELLTIDGDHVVEGDGMFEKVMYLSIFYFIFLLRGYQRIW